MRRLTKRSEFLAVRAGRRAHASSLSVEALGRPDGGEARAGFTVTKKTGGAVERNRIRRRLREALRRVACEAKPGYDYVLIGRRSALEAPFASIVGELSGLLARLHGQKAPSGRRET